MAVTAAVSSDVHKAVLCLAAAFAQDPITGFLLQTGQGYPERLAEFLSLLMRARIALQMPVLVAREATDIQGVAMGYTTLRAEWPTSLTDEWKLFERSAIGLAERLTVYEQLADEFKPSAPHYYLGAIGVDPRAQGLGIGMQLLDAFCDRSASDRLSSGVYLETAKESNVTFYERAGFVQTGRGSLAGNTLWCMYLPHAK